MRRLNVSDIRQYPATAKRAAEDARKKADELLKNIEQFNLLSLMLKSGVDVFIAGDENQSIYGFRGANADNFNAMIEQMKSSKAGQILNENFRADNNLLENINYIFKSKFYYNETQLISYFSK